MEYGEANPFAEALAPNKINPILPQKTGLLKRQNVAHNNIKSRRQSDALN
jgi:hypothetical protein